MKVSTITGWVLSITAVVFVVLLTGVGSNAFTDDPPAVSPYASRGGSTAETTVASGDAALLRAGKDVYAANCARCHGADLGGGIGPAIGAGSIAATLTTDQLTTVIADGRGRMPSWGSRLDVDEIEAVVAFLEDAAG